MDKGFKFFFYKRIGKERAKLLKFDMASDLFREMKEKVCELKFG